MNGASDPPLAALPNEGDSATWHKVAKALLAKTIGELAYEQLLAPEPAGGRYLLMLTRGITYTFAADRGPFGDWRVAPGSITRSAGRHVEEAWDPLRFVVDSAVDLDLDGDVVADMLRELAATLVCDVRLLRQAPSATELADMPYLELERTQTGHPCMILNKGRLGFSATDSARYTPEAGHPLRLRWIAAHRSMATYHGVAGLDEQRLLAEELDPETRAGFASRIAEAGYDPSGYVWLPVHPWHWDEVVAILFAPYLADGGIVRLGEAPDRYLPLQSVRTLANIDSPQRRDVKLPLMIRNTLVWRGLATESTEAAPEVTEWLQRLCARDAFLRDETGIGTLGEVASVAVHHPLFEQVALAPYRYHELLGAVWREPVAAHLRPDERARTMACLLQVDPEGRALVAELVDRSGLGARGWLRRFLAALLPGLLHYLCRYGVAFCPHGENVVVVYDTRDIPQRVLVKDLAEDVNLLPEELPEYEDMPPSARAVLLRWDAQQLSHSLQSAVFAGHFRFLAPLFDAQLGVPEREFWMIVRDEVLAYQARFPELSGRVAAFNLLGRSFDRICLNREHLRGAGFHDRADRDESFDVSHGTVPNPLHQEET